jgi:hypothetical protein
VCREHFRQADAAVRAAGVGDGEAHRMEGFPHLRVNRFLASFADEVGQPAHHADWLMRLRELDHAARAAELSNLDPDRRRRLAARLGVDPFPAELNDHLDRCAAALMPDDDASRALRARLRTQAQVPDDYDGWKRVVGLYWLSRLPFSAGVDTYQREVARMFEQPVETLNIHGHLIWYLPQGAAAAAAMPARSADALGIPILGGKRLDDLFAAHAPVWIVDQADDDDRIGSVALDAARRVHVALDRPVTYRRLAYTRFGQEVLAQLVYSIWFPARPKVSATDLLGGHLDSLVWRVTLDRQGQPLLYDSIHGCGCYHQFFPTARLRLRARPARLEEGALVPQVLPALASTPRIGLRIESCTHYLQRVLTDMRAAEAGLAYGMLPDESLRSLVLSSGESRSAFGADGIVVGSERAERYLFWPMGVREPGAMRQWGRHATAFLGRRHFDDARLIERYFELAPNSGS